MPRKVWRDYEAAEKFASELGLKSQAEWKKFAKDKTKLPGDIPANPQATYKEQFRGWGKWMGTGNTRNKDKRGRFLPHDEAMLLFHRLNLGLTNQSEWWEYCQSGQKPDCIPADPQTGYKDSGWVSWGKWLGTDYVAHRHRTFRPHGEARKFIRSLGLANQSAWITYSQSDARPRDIPSNPQAVYGAEYRGIHDWLGTSQRHVSAKLTKKAILAVLEDLFPNLSFLRNEELLTLLQQGGVLPVLAAALGGISPMRVLKELRAGQSQGIKAAVRAMPSNDLQARPAVEGHREEFGDRTSIAASDDLDDMSATGDADRIDTAQGLRVIDEMAESALGVSAEAAEFLVDNRVAALWDHYVQDEGNAVDEMVSGEGGHWFNTIRDRFKSQKKEVDALPIPPTWSLMKKGQPCPPLLMQRLVACRLRDKGRLLNMSDVGTGKTGGAVLGSRVVGAHLTLIITNLTTIDGWKNEIRAIYPDSEVYIDLSACAFLDRSRFNYLILNYDKFQRIPVELIEKLLDLRPDLVVLDEVQLVKQRTPEASQRRVAVATLLSRATEQNSDLYVLGLSATPMVNNLREPKTALELIVGRSFPTLKTKSNVGNALAIHRAMMSYGLRLHAHHVQELETHTVVADGIDLVPDLLRVGITVLSVEQLMLSTRLEAARTHIRAGTLIYTHFVEGMVGPIQRFVKSMGLSVGIYTGEDKSGLDAFMGGAVDVLVGSAPMAVGLDGLQRVSNRLVVLSLPWTHAQYDQLIGRLRRQGSPFPQVKVIVPEVVVQINGDSWSWDQERMALIVRKRTLADCVTDGVIPNATEISHEEMLRRSRMALDRLIGHVAPEVTEKVEEPTLASALGIRTTVSTEMTTLGHTHTA